jgi:hypothetical protein
MKMAISMSSAYAEKVKEAARLMERHMSARELYEQLARQLHQREREQGYADFDLRREVERYKKRADDEENEARLKIEAEESRLAEEMRMPHNVCTVSAAVELWIVKFGDGWVRKRDVPNIATPDTMNWTRLARRLHDVHRMEDQNDHWRVIT